MVAELAVVIANGSHCPIEESERWLACRVLNLQNHEDLLQPVRTSTKSLFREEPISSMPGGAVLHLSFWPPSRPLCTGSCLSRRNRSLRVHTSSI